MHVRLFKPFVPNIELSKAIYWYFALRAANRFHRQHGRYPGTGVFESLDAEHKALGEVQEALFKEYGISAPTMPETLQEMYDPVRS